MDVERRFCSLRCVDVNLELESWNGLFPDGVDKNLEGVSITSIGADGVAYKFEDKGVVDRGLWFLKTGEVVGEVDRLFDPEGNGDDDLEGRRKLGSSFMYVFSVVCNDEVRLGGRVDSPGVFFKFREVIDGLLP